MNRNKVTKLSRTVKWMVSFLARSEQRSSLSGDYEEEYRDVAKSKGIFQAKTWIWAQFVKSLPYFIQASSIRNMSMLRNYLKIAIRNIKKQKLYSFITVTGLSLAFSAFILIALFVLDELSFDKFHKNKDNIFGITSVWNSNTSRQSEALSSPPLMRNKLLEAELPQIKEIVRFITPRTAVFSYGNTIGSERVTYTDPSMFQVFSFKLLSGAPETVLASQDNVVISESIAKKYFGDEDPLGKTVLLQVDQERLFTVAGILHTPPANSSIQFEIVVPIENMQHLIKNAYYEFLTTYILLHDGYTSSALEKRLAAMSKDLTPEWLHHLDIEWRLKNIQEIHLDSSLGNRTHGSDPVYSLILSGIAVIILTVAVINFVNMALARSSLRSSEIGMRKVFGAAKLQLIKQFWSESVVLTLLALVFGTILAAVYLPYFNLLSGKYLSVSDFLTTGNVLTLTGFAIIIGVVAGSYPAVIMSSFKPVAILKNTFTFGKKNILTGSLIVLQFSLSIFLITSTILLGKQVNYMLTKDIGFNKDNVIKIFFDDQKAQRTHEIYRLFKEKIIQHPNVVSATASNGSIGARGGRVGGILTTATGEKIRFSMYTVDHDYLTTLGLTLTSGRNFSKNFSNDSTSVLINESFAKAIGMEGATESAIGNPSSGYPANKKVIGIVKDFNFLSLHNKITPVLLQLDKRRGKTVIMVKINDLNVHRSIDFLKDTWSKVAPDKPFVYYFLDEDIEGFYEKEKKWSTIISYSTTFAVIIACMGIFGMISITVGMKIKEIGIRKVLGAKALRIIYILVKQYIVVIGIANLIAWTAAYFAAEKFLQGYYYRITLDSQYFLTTGLLSIVIAFSVISYTTLKAALRNPVEALRHE